MKSLASGLTNESSILFVLVRKSTPDKVLEEVKKYGGTVLQTSLTHEDKRSSNRSSIKRRMPDSLTSNLSPNLKTA